MKPSAVLLAALLALGPAQAIPAKAAVVRPSASAVVEGLAGALRELPPQAQAPLSAFLNTGVDAAGLARSLDALPPMTEPPGISALQAAPEPAADRALVASVAQPFLTLVEEAPSSAGVATRLAVLERVLAPRVSPQARAGLVEAAGQYRRELSERERGALAESMRRVIEQLGPARDAAAADGEAASAVAAPGGRESPPPQWRLEPAKAAPDTRTALQIFREANPKSDAPSLLGGYGFRFEETAAEILYHRVFNADARAPFQIEQTGLIYSMLPGLHDALWEIIHLADRAAHDPNAARFAQALGRAQALQDAERLDSYALAAVRWPDPPFPGGEYWDLAAGPNAGFWMWAGLDPSTHYRLFDVNPFVSGYLDSMAEIGRARGIVRARVTVEKPEESDILRLKRPRSPLSAIRAKNIETYVPGSTDALERMTDWIAEGGQLVLQNNPDHRELDVSNLGPMIERLIGRGWQLRYIDPPAAGYDLQHVAVYSLILTKPRGDVPPADLLLRAAASRKVWDQFKGGVRPSWLRRVFG
ncbi:MAG TPA: hypothetical protein VNI01_12215 [Elusimicrobiota bacterium]|jgi:hypothetical protein|nr:hypothetical protein [Elusimicrobiota bacterium]